MERRTIFSGQTALVKFAERFVDERVTSVQHDIWHCMTPVTLPFSPLSPQEYAPFPALLYCFATIELLGALYAGNAAGTAKTSKQSMEYMVRFMGYTEEQSRLLWKIFRHKMVHLSQPKSVIRDGRRLIAWQYFHREPRHPEGPFHLRVRKLSKTEKLSVTSSFSVPYDHVFSVSIEELPRDIEYSAARYLASLGHDPALQQHFEAAIRQIYAYGK